MSRIYKQTSFTSDDLFATVSFGGGGRSVFNGHPSAMSANQYYDAYTGSGSSATVSSTVGACTYATIGGNGVQSCINSDGSVTTTSCLGTVTPAGTQVCTTTTIR